MQKLKDVMSKDVQIISPGATIADAALQMKKGNFGMMPVGEQDRMIGVISDRDIAIRAVAEGKPPTTAVREIMTEGIFCASENDSVEDAAQIMSKHQIRRLPVVDADKRLVGIVALGDFAVAKEDVKAASDALAAISK